MPIETFLKHRSFIFNLACLPNISPTIECYSIWGWQATLIYFMYWMTMLRFFPNLKTTSSALNIHNKGINTMKYLVSWSCLEHSVNVAINGKEKKIRLLNHSVFVKFIVYMQHLWINSDKWIFFSLVRIWMGEIYFGQVKFEITSPPDKWAEKLVYPVIMQHILL